ncbi:hypothetical protein CHS0354_030617 [Potamilus streckersoni]|uniref:S-adenosylmethionine sensor upstream of mTORC1 n=1 Tax=Potamilus streckersoni TaxID=2493646 RepID=A0AAE0SCQ8_9BIVA|nr:hypothetical protein CHS0354_030617 [Potamilus streckersoni]
MSEEGKEDAHTEHLRLAGVVKGVHAELRKKYKDSSSFEQLWEEHCQNKQTLSQYADAMHHLAVDHWAKHPGTRIVWTRDTVLEYFFKGGLNKQREKDERRKMHCSGKDDSEASQNKNDECSTLHEQNSCSGACDRTALYPRISSYNNIALQFGGKIRLLDVGSCFNPFLDFEEFLTIGIDISPARPSVYHCDFLHLHIMEPLQVAPDTMNTYFSSLKDPIHKLPRESFHVLVFSLLLEYFPAPYQRWICCQKAWDLLMYDGILVIITPDSHQQHRNALMMKSWKKAIESMGFNRWRYVKQEHLHCMVFRKIVKKEKKDNLISDITPDMLYIPQDFNDLDMVH